jgi:hypothetical protein
MSIRPAEAEEQRPGCRLEATEERPRRAPNPPPATNPGRRSEESTRIHRRKIAKSTAPQQRYWNSWITGLLQRAAILQAHHAGVMRRALAALEQKGLNSWVIRDAIAPQWIWRKNGRGSWWILGGSLGNPSRERAGQSPFVACRPRQSGTGVPLTGKRPNSPSQPPSPPLIAPRRPTPP